MAEARLSKMYADACDRIQKAGADLYETLHDNKGRPEHDVTAVIDIVAEHRRWILIELDFIREAVKEHAEASGSKQ